MEFQEGDIAEDGQGNYVVYRSGQWFPSQQDGRPLERIPRPDYGANHFQLPNGDIVRQGPRGGQETVENFGGAGGGAGGGALVGADARGRYNIGADSLVASSRAAAAEEAKGGNPLNRDWGAVVLNSVDLDPRADSSFRPLAPIARLVGGQDFQNYDQALATYEASLLPIQSGASVTESEARRQIRADFPQLGDSEETVRRKAANRLRRINAVFAGIGRPLPFTEEQIANPVSVAMEDELAALNDPEIIAAAQGGAGGDAGGPPEGPVDISGMSAAELLQLTPGTQIRLPDGTVTRLTGAPSVGAQGREVSPGVFAQETPEQAVAAREEMSPILRRVDGAVRGIADTLTFGLADEIAAAGDTMVRRGSYDQNLQRQKAIDRSDEQAVPVSRGAGQVAGAVLAPGAMTAGRFIARAPNLAGTMTRSAVVGGGFGAAYGAGSAEGSRVQGAMTGGMTGAAVGAAVPPLARGVGAALAPVTRPFTDAASDAVSALRGRPMTREDRAARTLLTGADPDQLAAEAARFRAQGVEPTLADVGGSNVQSRVRVAATRQTPGRDIAEGFAAGRRQDVQEYTAGLGSRVSPLQATPDELDAALTAYQRDASRKAFDPIRADRIRLDDNSIMALRGDEGRAAIRQAARAFGSSVDENERAVAAELNRLADAVIDTPNVEITVGAADLMSRYLSKAGGTDMNLRRIFGGAGRAIRDNARTQNQGYDQALQGYAARASLSDAATAGEAFIGNRGYAQDYVGAVRAMTEPQRAVAAAAGRAGLERAAETPAGAMRALDALAVGRGQQMRSEALLGAEGAAGLREAGVIGRRMMTTANNVSPRSGSPTFLNQQDGGAVGNLARGKPFSAALDYMRSRGISDQDAETLVSLALDAANTDDAIAALARSVGPAEARRIVEQMVPVIAGQAGAASQPRMAAPQP